MKTKAQNGIDIQIAEKLFGFRLESDGYWRSPDQEDAINGEEQLWSSDPELAMKVLDELRRRGYRILINMDKEGFHLRHVACVVQDGIRNEKVYHCDKHLGWAKALNELPKTICEAALELLK